LDTATFSALLERVTSALPENIPAFLVGGAVRDILLQRISASHDLDFVVEGNAQKTARIVADKLNAAYFPLHDTFDAARVLYTISNLPGHPNSGTIILDFAGMRGIDLYADLRERDFTINAMALDLRRNNAFVDPLGGVNDLKNKLVRSCSPHTFLSDPIRLLRALRLANNLDLTIEPQTRQLMRSALPHIRNTSPERQRDEIIRICGGKKPARAFPILDAMDILAYILPELIALKDVQQSPPHVHNVWNHTLAALDKLEYLLANLEPNIIPDPVGGFSSNLAMGLASVRLGAYRQQIQYYIETQHAFETPHRPLLFFAALYHDAGKPIQRRIEENTGRVRFLEHEKESARLISSRAKEFHMSHTEIAWLSTIVRYHMRPLFLSMNNDIPSRRSIYRFFRDTGAVGIDICLLSLADFLATYEYSLPQDKWSHHLNIIETLFDGWWNKHETYIAPTPLLNGNDLLEHFTLQPGPLIGKILDAVKEAQASGEIKTQDEALSLAKSIILQHNT